MVGWCGDVHDGGYSYSSSDGVDGVGVLWMVVMCSCRELRDIILVPRDGVGILVAGGGVVLLLPLVLLGLPLLLRGVDYTSPS